MPIRIRVADASPHELLAVYVRDHLAGAVGGRDLARRATRTAERPEDVEILRAIARDIGLDLVTLRRCAAALGIPRPRGRELAAAVAERAGRSKLNGQLRGTSPLSSLVEVEGLLLGVTGKLGCWRTLRAAGARRHLPADIDLETLEQRALDQQHTLQLLHARVRERVLGGAARPAGARRLRAEPTEVGAQSAAAAEDRGPRV